MSAYDFETQTHGKWILAGEHAVLRGHPALVFPLKGKTLALSYQQSERELTVQSEGTTGDVMEKLFWHLLGHVREVLGHALSMQIVFTGYVRLFSDIPVGRGMGASAALSVAMARWLSFQGYLTEPIASFAKTLENLFHGQSSGLDIVGVAAQEGYIFKAGHAQRLQQRWSPQWVLSFSGEDGMTAHCIEQVKNIWLKNPTHAEAIDQSMRKSVLVATQALSEDKPEALEYLARAVEEAANCFKAWGLVNESLAQHMIVLKKRGALATKPTGSGGGGYVLSLWPKETSIALLAKADPNLIPL
ncbi:MAG: mevalonate kinase [Legionella sp.]|nr:mevalonate kinase [Legionella sp.]